MTVRPPIRRATIRDVARVANASTAAVSRVLRDAYGVSDEMKARVKVAIDELGYRPHAAARGMRGKSYTIGIVHPDIRNTFFPDVISAFADLVLPTNRQLFFASSEWSSAQEVLAAMSDRQMEGIVVVAPSISETKLREAARQTSLVVTHRHSFSKEYDTIVSDDSFGAEAVVGHLAELGHKHIVHFGHVSARAKGQLRSVSNLRAHAYSRAMEERGLGEYAETVECSSYTFADGYHFAKEVLNRDKIPTAIFAGTDNVAFGIMQYAFEMGLKIPDDFSLVGYDNTQMAALGSISLTSVDQDPKEIGVRAAQFMLSRIEGRREAQSATFEPNLIVRGTCGPPPVR